MQSQSFARMVLDLVFLTARGGGTVDSATILSGVVSLGAACPLCSILKTLEIGFKSESMSIFFNHSPESWFRRRTIHIGLTGKTVIYKKVK